MTDDRNSKKYLLYTGEEILANSINYTIINFKNKNLSLFINVMADDRNFKKIFTLYGRGNFGKQY